jgi:hypothetical protein
MTNLVNAYKGSKHYRLINFIVLLLAMMIVLSVIFWYERSLREIDEQILKVKYIQNQQ